MSNLYQADQVAAIAATFVAQDLHLVPTVDRTFEGTFVPGAGKRIFVRVPSAAVSRDRGIDDVTSSVIFDELSETAVPIDLSTHALSAVVLSEGDMTLRLDDFGLRVLSPQAEAVADRIEAAVADVLNATTKTPLGTFDSAVPVQVFTRLRRALRDRGVDLTKEENFVVAGGNVIDRLLDSKALDFSATGDSDALRAGTVGKLRGFTILESSRVDADDVIAYPKHAVHLAVRAPLVPAGVFGEITKDKPGLVSLRAIQDYDSTKTATRSVVSTFVGAQAMPAYRITRNRTAGTAVAAPITGGHIVRMTVA